MCLAKTRSLPNPNQRIELPLSQHKIEHRHIKLQHEDKLPTFILAIGLPVHIFTHANKLNSESPRIRHVSEAFPVSTAPDSLNFSICSMHHSMDPLTPLCSVCMYLLSCSNTLLRGSTSPSCSCFMFQSRHSKLKPFFTADILTYRGRKTMAWNHHCR